MPRERNEYILGMEKFLNNPNTSYKTNPHVFDEIKKQTGMSISEMFKHVGRTSKYNTQRKEPTDKEKSEQRLTNLETNSQKE